MFRLFFMNKVVVISVSLSKLHKLMLDLKELSIYNSELYKE